MRLLLTLVGMLAAAGIGATPDWRLSDALGNDRGPAPRGASTAGWVLRIEVKDRVEERTLFQDQGEETRCLVDRDEDQRVLRLREFRGGDAVWEVAYDPTTGLPVTETSFQDDLPAEIATLVFEDNVLSVRRVTDPAGNLLYTDTLRRWPDGRVRRMERDGPSGPLASSAWSYGPEGALSAASTTVGTDAQERRQWTFSGAKSEETRSVGDQVVLTRVTEWLSAGISREVVTEPRTDRTFQRSLDARGRVTEETESRKGVLVQTRRWTYDGQGRVLEASVESAGPRETWTYTYDGDVVGRLTRDGVLVREETTREGETLQVRLFDRGELFLVEAWSGGKRIKETYYKQGAVVRERSR